MEKEFVPYEQALELRELGFDEPHFKSYVGISNNGDIKDCTYVLCNGKLNNDDVSAPTFSQAFRWFREKYNIQGYIYSSTVRGNAEKTKQFTGYIWNINGIDMPFISTDARDELHDTYEEAELECLNTLIKIVKNK
jgi:hypothetical protein